MMEKKIVKVLKVIVYDDDSSEVINLDIDSPQNKNEHSLENNDYLDLAKCSSRIGQILTVITLVYREQMSNGFNDINLKKDISLALKQTAVIYGVSLQSIQDKVARQLNIKTIDFRNYVYEFIINDNKKIFDLLEEKISSHNSQFDNNAIKAFKNNPNLTVRLANGETIKPIKLSNT